LPDLDNISKRSDDMKAVNEVSFVAKLDEILDFLGRTVRG